MVADEPRTRQPPRGKREREPLRETEVERYGTLTVKLVSHYVPVIGAVGVLVYWGLMAHRFKLSTTSVNPGIRTMSRMTGLNQTTVVNQLRILAGEDETSDQVGNRKPGKLEHCGLPPLIRIEKTKRLNKINGATSYHFLDPELPP